MLICSRRAPLIRIGQSILLQLQCINAAAQRSFIAEEYRVMIPMPIMACCILLADTFKATKPRGYRDDTAFLAMASGWFGRLQMMTKHDFAFKELMRLIGLAQQLSTDQI